MMQLLGSIERAERLLGSGLGQERFVILKIRPGSPACCCSNCVPDAWDDVNRHIAPAGPVEHEGDALVETPSGSYVVEQHESGPELVALVSVLADNVTLARTFIDLGMLFARRYLRRKLPQNARVQLETRRFLHGQLISETILTIDNVTIPDSGQAVVATLLACARPGYGGDAKG